MNDRRIVGARQCDGMVIALTFRDQYYRRYRGYRSRIPRAASRHSTKFTETFDSPESAKEARSNGSDIRINGKDINCIQITNRLQTYIVLYKRTMFVNELD